MLQDANSGPSVIVFIRARAAIARRRVAVINAKDIGGAGNLSKIGQRSASKIGVDDKGDAQSSRSPSCQVSNRRRPGNPSHRRPVRVIQDKPNRDVIIHYDILRIHFAFVHYLNQKGYRASRQVRAGRSRRIYSFAKRQIKDFGESNDNISGIVIIFVLAAVTGRGVRIRLFIDIGRAAQFSPVGQYRAIRGLFANRKSDGYYGRLAGCQFRDWVGQAQGITAH